MVSINFSQGSVGLPKINFQIKNRAALAANASAGAANIANRADFDVKSDVQNIFNKLFDSQSTANVDLAKHLSGKGNTVFQDFVESFSINNYGNLKQIDEYDAEQAIFTIAAKYSSVKYSIANGNFSENEKQELNANLESQLKDGIETLTSRFGDAAKSLFSALGDDNAHKNAAESLEKLILDQADKFTSFLDSQEGKEYLSSNVHKYTQDSGVKVENLGDATLTKMLIMHEAEKRVEEQEKANKQEPNKLEPNANKADKKEDKEDKGPLGSFDFNLNDLKSLGELSKSIHQFNKADISQSEEQIGYTYGLSYVKSLDVLKRNNASDKLTSLLKNGYEHLIEQDVENRNKTLQSKQEQNEEFSEANQNKQAYTALNLSTIMKTFNGVIGSYQQKGSLEDAVIDGFENAKTVFQINLASNERSIRYQASQDFFKNFYNTTKESNPYNSSRSDYSMYMKMMDF